MTLVPTDAETLMRQASMTANEYAVAAIESIDRLLGEGYAKAHPELIAAFITAAAQDFHTAMMVKAIERAAEMVADSACDDSVRIAEVLEEIQKRGITTYMTAD